MSGEIGCLNIILELAIGGRNGSYCIGCRCRNNGTLSTVVAKQATGTIRFCLGTCLSIALTDLFGDDMVDEKLIVVFSATKDDRPIQTTVALSYSFY
jgi:hypothetical protein